MKYANMQVNILVTVKMQILYKAANQSVQQAGSKD